MPNKIHMVSEFIYTDTGNVISRYVYQAIIFRYQLNYLPEHEHILKLSEMISVTVFMISSLEMQFLVLLSWPTNHSGCSYTLDT